ncbi:TRAP transporter small permease [Salinicoccus sesuvii]|uniref:TRAP transporter small permease n=1 Tax=Salinicoccus sesuvii TaxID=868281 RepID=A0ABV7N1V2_9STAP
MEDFKSRLDMVLSGLCAGLLAFMTILTIFQVFMRYVIQQPSTVSEDLLGFAFVWVSLLATALVFGQKDHIKITLLSDKITGIGGLILKIFSEVLIMIVAMAVFVIGGKYLMDVGALQLSPTLGINLNWIYIVLPISGILIIFYNIHFILMEVKNYRQGVFK